MSKKGKQKQSTGDGHLVIAQNKRARHEYTIEDTFEAGLELQGWEVKALRAGHGSLVEAYVHFRKGEGYLVGANFTPLRSTSTHYVAFPTRMRKLLLHRYEIDRLIGKTEQAGYSVVPLKMYFKNGRVKLEIGLGKGKQKHDKRADIKDREWQRDKARIMKKGTR